MTHLVNEQAKAPDERTRNAGTAALGAVAGRRSLVSRAAALGRGQCLVRTRRWHDRAATWRLPLMTPRRPPWISLLIVIWGVIGFAISAVQTDRPWVLVAASTVMIVSGSLSAARGMRDRSSTSQALSLPQFSCGTQSRDSESTRLLAIGLRLKRRFTLTYLAMMAAQCGLGA